jgi:lysine 2,3-aminomutase
MHNRIRSVAQLLEQFPSLRNASTGIEAVVGRYPMAITPYYASLIQRADMSDPVFQMAVPQMDELHSPPCLAPDPLQEDRHTPVPGLLHRYPDRALVLATTQCAAYCRHCTRKRVAGASEQAITADKLKTIADYLRSHPGIREVIVSGGDPLTLPDNVLTGIMDTIKAIPNIEVIRIGTRVPVVIPQRITADLTALLRRYHPVWINTHFNHPREVTPDAAAACARLADAGIPLGNQTVLLRGVNDSPDTIEDLCRRLIRIRVRPYYLFQCDLVKGIEHFRTPLRRGVEIMEHLRGRISGYAIPTFVVDTPSGAGKVPVLPDYVVSSNGRETVFRTPDGGCAAYPEPGSPPS